MHIQSTGEAMQHLLDLAVTKFKKEYPAVTHENIVADMMYGQFFRNSLLLTKRNLPHAKQVLNQDNTKVMQCYHNAILILISKIEKNLGIKKVVEVEEEEIG